MVGLSERADQRTDTIGIRDRKCRVRGQSPDPPKRPRLRDRRLEGKPFVDNERIVGVAGVKILECLHALGPIVLGKRLQRGHAIGHVVCALVL